MNDREVTGIINKDGFVTFDEEVTIVEPQAVTILFKSNVEANKPAKPPRSGLPLFLLSQPALI